MQELEQENKDMDKCVEEILAKETKDNFRLSATTLTVFRYLSIKNLIRTYLGAMA